MVSLTAFSSALTVALAWSTWTSACWISAAVGFVLVAVVVVFEPLLAPLLLVVLAGVVLAFPVEVDLPVPDRFPVLVVVLPLLVAFVVDGVVFVVGRLVTAGVVVVPVVDVPVVVVGVVGVGVVAVGLVTVVDGLVDVFVDASVVVG